MKSINKLALGVGVVTIGLFGCPKKPDQNPITNEARAKIVRVIPKPVAPNVPEASAVPETSISAMPEMTRNLNVLISDIKRDSLEVCKNRDEHLKVLDEAIENCRVGCDKIHTCVNLETISKKNLNKRKKNTLKAYKILKEQCGYQAIEIPILKEDVEQQNKGSRKNDLLQKLSKISMDSKEACSLLETRKEEEDQEIARLSLKSNRAATKCRSLLIACRNDLNTLRLNRADFYRKNLARCAQRNWLDSLPKMKPLRSTDY